MNDEMNDGDKAKTELLDELNTLRLRNEQLEARLREARALRAPEDELQLFTTGPVVVFKWRNREGWPVEYVSENVEAVLGYSVSEFISGEVPFADLIPAEDLGRVAEEVKTNSESGATRFEHLPYRLVRKDGRTIWVADYTVILRDDTGAVTHYLGYILDITRRREAEEALAASEYFLNDIVESIQDGISVLDRDLNILRANGIMKRWYGKYSSLEAKKCFHCLRNREAPCDSCPVRRCFRSGGIEQEIVPGLPGSSVEWLELFCYPVKDRETGVTTSVVQIARDISQRRRAEDERVKLEARIQQARKLESLNVMAGSIAHNFNNLLMIVLGNLEMLKWEAEEKFSGDEFVENARKAARRASDLSTLMLTYVGQGNADLEVVNLTRLLKDMDGMLKLAVPNKIKLVTELVDKPLIINGDPEPLRQVIVNLVNNAHESIEDGPGAVTISTGVMAGVPDDGRFAVYGELPGQSDYIYVEIADTGRGMDEKTRALIFDPFFTTKFIGRGLGLSAVLGVMRVHRGAILLDSAPGEGTRIRILFPTPESAPRPSSVPDDGLGADAVGHTVLLVDEASEERELARNILEEMGYRALAASGGREALEIFFADYSEICCVILDMNLPDLTVAQVLNEIKRIRPELPVLVSSNYEDEEVALLFNNMPVAGYIRKPYHLPQLQALFKRMSKSGWEHPTETKEEIEKG